MTLGGCGSALWPNCNHPCTSEAARPNTRLIALAKEPQILHQKKSQTKDTNGADLLTLLGFSFSIKPVFQSTACQSLIISTVEEEPGGESTVFFQSSPGDFPQPTPSVVQAKARLVIIVIIIIFKDMTKSSEHWARHVVVVALLSEIR